MSTHPLSAAPETATAPTSPAPFPGASSHPARSKARGKQSKLLLYIAIAALAVCGTAAAYVLIEKPFSKTRNDLETYTVQYGRLELKIVEKGTLEAANNSDI